MDTDRFLGEAGAGGPPPAGLSPELRALWEAAAGRWHAAHEVAQDLDTPSGSLIHAHLHREEGDLGNAGYWYRRAGEPMPADALADERRRLIERFLEPA